MKPFLTYKTPSGVIHRVIDPDYKENLTMPHFPHPIRPQDKRMEARFISLSKKIVLGGYVYRIKSIEAIDHDIKFTFHGGTSTTVPQNLEMVVQ